MTKFTHVISNVSVMGTHDTSNMTYVTEKTVQGLQHGVSAALSMCKPTDPPEVLKALESAYDFLKLLQYHAPIQNPMLL